MSQAITYSGLMMAERVARNPLLYDKEVRENTKKYLVHAAEHFEAFAEQCTDMEVSMYLDKKAAELLITASML